MPRPDASAKLAASKPKDNSKLNLIISVVLVGLLVIGGFTAVILTRGSGSTDAVGPAGSQAEGNGVLAYAGKAKAGVPDVQLYVDYQCPICNNFEQANGGQMMQMAQAGEIKLTIHVMSFLDKNLGNNSSAQAANAAFCAADAGLMPEFHTELFKRQPTKEGDGYPTSVYAQVAQQVGIKGAALNTFNKCVSDAKYAKYVEATEVRSGKNGVTGTPTVIINGKSSSDDKQMFNSLVQTPNSFRSIVEQNAKKS
ncbi:thioredoxin domain-containing protein [Yimella sp. cx-51]|uniref:thioredoxin domain-containing protein n=1 Tax=Yimella sp. cx-51 TaxID=2770551 RepID=UPI00165E075A|nr:thioredoxin domain-containing protein [Yimella sp. cx-51]MBC9956837.1 thioredoxin domain-containing protein [Yimella sp. cx-51]QTH39063.1 thioredoxin domain-containing protein [Yimella sp. cx-51]